jgi:hypothetical protein
MDARNSGRCTSVEVVLSITLDQKKGQKWYRYCYNRIHDVGSMFANACKCILDKFAREGDLPLFYFFSCKNAFDPAC